MPPIRLVTSYTVCAGHRLLRPEWTAEQNEAAFGKCTNPHGHQYKVEIALVGPMDEKTGMLVNGFTVDEIAKKRVIEQLDHQFLNDDLPFFHTHLPTAEWIAIWAAEQLKDAFPPHIFVERVRIYETETLYAEYCPREKPRGPIVTVSALIENEKGELFLTLSHKWGNRYGIPGGKIEAGETAEAALVREIREETEMEIDALEFALMMEDLSPPEFYLPHQHFIYLNYRARVKKSDYRLNEEAQAAVWVKPEAARDLLLNRPTRVLLTHCFPTLFPPQ